MKKEEIRSVKTFDELLDLKYGKIGEKAREAFEEKARHFIIREMGKPSKK